MFGNVNNRIKLLLVILFLSKDLLCVDIGSDSSVDRFTTQQTLNNGDRIAGFACLLAGFKLNSSSVSATFDSFFPVRGDIELNRGALSLDRDLIFRDESSFISLGDVTGNNRTLELSTTMTCVPNQDGTGENAALSGVSIFLNSDVYLNNVSLTFSGESTINGRGNCLTFSPTSTIVINSSAGLLFSNIKLKNISGNKIYCTDSTSTLSVQNVKWVQNGNFNFQAGHLEVFKDFEIIGDGYNFTYETDQQSIIKSNANIILDHNVTFSYAPSVANRDLINLYDDTANLVLRGATLFSTTTGLRLTKGNLIIERKSFIECDGTNYAESVSFGDGASAGNDITIETVGAANLEVLNGYVVCDNVSG